MNQSRIFFRTLSSISRASALFSLVFLFGFTPDAGAAGGIQVDLNNASSRTLHIYHAEPGEQLHYESALRSGRSQRFNSSAGETWALVNPETRTVVKSLQVSRFNRSLRVDNSSFGGGGFGRRQEVVGFSASNHSSRTANLYRANAGGQYQYVASVRSNHSPSYDCAPGTRWAFVNPGNNQIIVQGTARSYNPVLELWDRNWGGGGISPPPDHDHEEDRETVFQNRTGETLTVSREIPRMGALRYTHSGQIYPGRTLSLPIAPGENWQVLDSRGNRVKTGRGGGTDITISRWDLARGDQPEPEERTVNVAFVNLSGSTVDILVQQRYGNGDWTKAVLVDRINNNRQTTIQAQPGSVYEFRQAGSQTAFSRFTAPNRNATHQIHPARRGSGHRDHDHGDDRKHDDEGRGPLRFARDAIENLFGN